MIHHGDLTVNSYICAS
jgi:Adenylate kinase